MTGIDVPLLLINVVPSVGNVVVVVGLKVLSVVSKSWHSKLST